MYKVLLLVVIIGQFVFAQDPHLYFRNKTDLVYPSGGDNPNQPATWVNSLSEEYLWGSEQWNLWYKFINTFNTQGKITSSDQQVYDEGLYLYSYLSTYTYDFNGNNTERLVIFKRDSTLRNKYRYISSFSGDRLLQTEIFEWENETWVPAYKWLYEYNWNGTVKTIEYSEYFGEEYFIIDRKVYTYDSNRNPIEILIQDYGSANWTDKEQRILTYNQNLPVQESRYKRENNNWVLFTKFTHMYNSFNKIDSTRIEDFHMTGYFVSRTGYTYDENLNMTEELKQSWYQSNLVNYYKTTYAYQSLTEVEDNKTVPLTTLLHQNYPNPFNSQTSVSFQLPEAQQVELSIYNYTGQKLTTIFNGAKEQGDHQIQWDAAGFASGIYFCELRTASQRKSIKLILLK
ncbi:MAG: T9SS type A sorting domain-containing protein [Ignavibacteriaceae bacterium]|nr:T9SS type A sorting domain-containing protein [Ignavibacteriaceae bacterium]